MNKRFELLRCTGCWLLLMLTQQSVQAQCGRGTIGLKTTQRDWVKSFDDINRNYKKKTVKVSALRLFFYSGDQSKNCITFADLQKLDELAQQNLGKNPLSKNDPKVIKFITAIKAVAIANPAPAVTPTRPASTSPVSAIGPASTSPASATGPAVNDTDQATAEIARLLDEKRTQEENIAFWQWVATGLGMLALLLGGILGGLFWREKERSGWLQQEVDRQQHRLVHGNTNKLRHGNTNSSDKPTSSGNYSSGQTGWSDGHSDIPKTLTETADKSPGDKLPPEPQNPEPEPPVVPTESFFLSAPTARPDGTVTFLDRRQDQFMPSSSVYRFQLRRDNPDQAEFWFGDSPTLVSSALSYPQTYLEPACTYTSLNTRAKRIITDAPGQATLNGDVWQMTHKATIDFV